MNTKLITTISLLMIAAAMGLTAAAPQLDLVLANGRVIDPESGLDGVRHVGIRAGKIAAISQAALQGKEVVDVAGLVVSPGFIDLHAHGQQLPAARMQAFDGVTTQLELEGGSLPVAAFYQRVAKEGRPINYGTSAGWSSARISTIHDIDLADERWVGRIIGLTGWTTEVGTPEQVDRILNLVEQGLNEGAIGVGLLAGYAPAFGRKENYLLHRLAAKHGVPVFTHIRYISMIEPQSSFDGYQEVISMAASTGAHVHICHLNSTSLRDIDICGRAIADAQKRGLKITTEAYPYGAGSTGINAAFFRGADWTKRLGVDYGDLVYNRTGERLTAERMKSLQQTDPSGLIIIHFLDPDRRPGDQSLLDASVHFPGGAIASDGMPWQVDGKTITGDIWPLPEKAVAHPRSAGCFCRILGRYVRQRKVLTLMEAIRKCSLIPAQILEASTPAMKNKGRLKPEADADIIVFDPEQVIDRATYEQPAQTSAGMRHVLVHGEFVIRNEKLLPKALPGRPVRRTVR